MLKSTPLLLALLVYGPASAQKAQPPRPVQLPASQPVISVTPIAPANGVRYEYQLVRLDNDSRVLFAPAWQGRTVLEPDLRSLTRELRPGATEALLLHSLNALSAEGWELLEIRTSVQPVSATQTVETSLSFSDPNRPQYDSKTTYHSDSQTRYLLRRALAR